MCQEATISNVEMMTADGEANMREATIISDTAKGTNNFTLNVNGTNEGGNYRLYCNESDVCNINCHSETACETLIIYCFGICHIHCDESAGL